jgi:hypothetical protein
MSNTNVTISCKFWGPGLSPLYRVLMGILGHSRVLMGILGHNSVLIKILGHHRVPRGILGHKSMHRGKYWDTREKEMAGEQRKLRTELHNLYFLSDIILGWSN